MKDRPDIGSRGSAPQAMLNEHHRRHLLASCQYIDRLLSDIDNIVTATETESPFARYSADLSPTLKRLLRDYCARLRADMLRILSRHNSMPAGRLISAVHAIRTALGFVEISVEELKPEYIGGYGHVPSELVPEINGFVEELQSVVRALDHALAAGEAGDVRGRLTRLERAGADVGVLAILERIIAEQGLVEFRPALETVLSRLEDQRFEIAVFGRVSSGKSSLLNHLLGKTVLPVGVTPITAVPTRVMYGQTPEVVIHFADRRTDTTTIDRLDEFVTEQGNPANTKHVTRLIVRMPAPRLADGIVFVDTPGLGSLATSGTAETLAYLPRCDLAVVLIDASSTLTEDDLRTLARLQQAAIPAMVVLSKADLLEDGDRDRAVAYAARHLSREFSVAIAVHAVSTVSTHESLLEAWIEEDLRPLLLQHRELARRSIQRKIGALRIGVQATLAARVRHRGSNARSDPAKAVAVEQFLRTASGAFDEVRRSIDGLGDARGDEIETALRQTAGEVANRLMSRSELSAPALVAETLGALGRDQSDRLARLLTTMAERSRKILRETADVLDLPEPSADDEWSCLLRELPQMDLGPLTITFNLPLLATFGRRVATARVYRSLAQQAGAQLSGALETHARLLRSWGLRVLQRFREKFDVHAQVYRSQLAGSTGRTSEDADVARALRELEALSAEVPSGR